MSNIDENIQEDLNWVNSRITLVKLERDSYEPYSYKWCQTSKILHIYENLRASF